jgi:hypothetical protein
MPYCSKCGVEVDDGVVECPLCSAAIPQFEEEQVERPRRYPENVDIPGPPLTSLQIRMALWAALSAILLIALFSVLAVNLVWTGGSITWASYAMASIGVALVACTTILILFKRPWLVVLSNYPSVVAYLALLDLFDGGLDWFLPLGLPITTATFLVPIVSLILWMFWKDRGTNQIAILLCLVAALSLGIDLAASAYLGDFGLSWSYVVIAILVPLAGFLFVYHYVLRRFIKLDRIFHV